MRWAWGVDVIDELVEGLAPTIERTMAEYRVPGVAFTVASLDATLSRHFGVTHPAHPLEITDATIFQVGSVSKIFTGTTVMRLVERGVLDLDVPVRRWIPRQYVQPTIPALQRQSPVRAGHHRRADRAP